MLRLPAARLMNQIGCSVTVLIGHRTVTFIRKRVARRKLEKSCNRLSGRPNLFPVPPFYHSFTLLDRVVLESCCARLPHNTVTCSFPGGRYLPVATSWKRASDRFPVSDLIWLIHEVCGRLLGRFQDVEIRCFLDVSLHILRAMLQGTSAGRQTT